MFATMAKQLSLLDFQTWFPDDESCYRLLLERRWPNGFVCPKCGAQNAARLSSRAYTFACRDCGSQTSATAGVEDQVGASLLPVSTPESGDSSRPACRLLRAFVTDRGAANIATARGPIGVRRIFMGVSLQMAHAAGPRLRAFSPAVVPGSRGRRAVPDHLRIGGCVGPSYVASNGLRHEECHFFSAGQPESNAATSVVIKSSASGSCNSQS